MQLLCMVEVYAGRLESNDSPRGESIFVTWRPKIYHEDARWRVRAFQIGWRIYPTWPKRTSLQLMANA